MATLTKQEVVRSGLNTTYSAVAGGGDEFVNTGGEFVHIKNGNAATLNVTIATPNTVDGLAIADRVVSILTTEERMIGPFPTGTYNDANAKVQLTYDVSTTVTIAILGLGA